MPPRRRPIDRPEPDAAPWPVQWHAASAALCASARNAGCGPVHGAARSVALARQSGQGVGWMDQRIEPPGLASAAQHAGAALAWVALTGVPSPPATLRA